MLQEHSYGESSKEHLSIYLNMIKNGSMLIYLRYVVQKR